MTQSNFTRQAETVLRLSQEAAQTMGHAYVGTEHLLLGLMKEKTGVAHLVLASMGVQEVALRQCVMKQVGSGIAEGKPLQGLTPRSRRGVELAIEVALCHSRGMVNTEHLLCGLLRQGNNRAMEVLHQVGVDDKQLYMQLMQRMQMSAKNSGGGESQRSSVPKEDSISKYKLLREFSRDLTAMAKAGELDPVIGREEEIQRVIQILSRRSKNNPCLIGEPGVGKTAVIEGLARKIALGDVPQTLANQKLLSLDLSAMVAGTKYRGEFEDRIKKLLEEVRKAGDVLVFIDEIHTIVGAGSAEGAVDAANILKPTLGRGELRVIGATTVSEYRKHIEKDAALERRFQPVTVEEPSYDTAIAILKGLQERYETHHGLTITQEAITTAVALSQRYIHGRFLPDKAVDLMDEAAAAVAMEVVEYPGIGALEEKLWQVERDKETAINTQNYETAAKLREVELDYLEQLTQLRLQQRQAQPKHRSVTAQDVAAVVSRWTGIPVKRVEEAESQRLQQMEQRLHQRVVGQNEAVSAVARAIRRSRVGLKDPRRPIGSFLFLGPTGVGKTELCKTLAQAMFGAEEAMIRLDMSEYREAHSLSRLVGAPPGYVGHEEGGQLTERVRRRPYSVVLFDEIEKAHEDIWNLLLQILEDGTITDSQGRRVDFQNTVLVMTSNLGAGQILTAGHHVGFGESTLDDDFVRTKQQVMEVLERTFRPEFLNRIDETVVFRQLEEGDLHTIAQGMLSATAKRMEALGIGLCVTQEAVGRLCQLGHTAKYGARPLRRCIQAQVEDSVASQLLDGTLEKGDTAHLVVEGDSLKITKQA